MLALLLLATTFWAPPQAPRVRYSIDCTIEAAKLSGVAEIRFITTGARPLQRLALDWSQLYPLEITAGGKPVTMVKRAAPALFDLPQPAAPGAAVALRIEFSRPINLERGPFTLSRFYPSAGSDFRALAWQGILLDHDQYGMAINRAWVEQRLATPFQR